MNSKHFYTVTQRNLLLIGTGLVILGSFLPWEQRGDFLSDWRYGIQLVPVFADHGGMLVLLFGILIILLMFRSEGILNYPAGWILTSAIALCMLSTFHILGWLVRHIFANGTIGAPAIRIGLIFVGLGFILLLATAIVMNLRGSTNHVQE